jgi:hypothetical protein
MPDRSTARPISQCRASGGVPDSSAISVDPAWIESVRDLRQGTVVVLRNLNFVDFLALDHLTKQFVPQVGSPTI